MKRILQFKQTSSGYACFENSENIFEICKSDLQFNVKDFYEAFYGEGKDFEDIVLENNAPEDKTAKRIYECINNLIERVSEKLAELPEEGDPLTE